MVWISCSLCTSLSFMDPCPEDPTNGGATMYAGSVEDMFLSG